MEKKKIRILFKLVVYWLMIGFSISTSGEIIESKATVNVTREETINSIEPPQTNKVLNKRLPQTNEKEYDFSILYLIFLMVLSSYYVMHKLQMKRTKGGNIK